MKRPEILAPAGNMEALKAAISNGCDAITKLKKLDMMGEYSLPADYKAKILPALKYCNYIILNEVESSMLSDLDPYNPDGGLNIDNIKKTMVYMAECGVKEKIIVHCKKAGFCYDVPTGNFTVVPSVNIPKSEIKGSVGAGDAFCAGSLYGIYNGFDDKHILEFAASAAACNLFSENSVDGMLNKNEIEKLSEKYGWEEL